MDLTFKSEKGIFNFRTCGIVMLEGKVLLEHYRKKDFWVLPGGRVSFGETSGTAVIREMEEELNMKVSGASLAYLIENYFRYDGYIYHEIAHLYYFNEILNISNFPVNDIVIKGADYSDQVFYWKDISELHTIDLKPAILKNKLPGFISGNFEHIICNYI